MRRLLALLVLAAALGLLAQGCAPRRPAELAPGFAHLGVREATSLAKDLRSRDQGLRSWRELEPGLRRSLAYVASRPQAEKAVDRPGLALTWGALRATLEDLLRLLPELDRDPGLLAREFTWFRLNPGTLLTGYYEPWLEASLTPDPAYPAPLYGVPPDLKVTDLGRFHPKWKGQQLTYRVENGEIAPYHDRQAIDQAGALSGRSLEIAWTRDPVEVFFLQIQGSGRLVLPDGRIRHVLYAGKNGREFVSLGKVLEQRGYLTKGEITMQSIKDLLASRPDLRDELLATNPSYVFFRLADQGPYGSAGQVLTPLVSAAVDRSMVPLGAVFALDSILPGERGETPFRGLMLAQDTGGAIKETRVDLFCGSDGRAEFVAGNLKSRAQVLVLVSNRALPGKN